MVYEYEYSITFPKQQGLPRKIFRFRSPILLQKGGGGTFDIAYIFHNQVLSNLVPVSHTSTYPGTENLQI